jgi:cation transport ATPase
VTAAVSTHLVDPHAHRDAEPACDHCGMPLPRPILARGPALAGSEPNDSDPAYCCLGCRIAAAIDRESSDGGSTRRMPARIGLAVFFSMNVMAFTMALWSGETPGPGESPTAIASTLHGLFRHLVLLFSLPVFFLLGLTLAENAWEAARRGIFSTDILLAADVAASFLYS